MSVGNTKLFNKKIEKILIKQFYLGSHFKKQNVVMRIYNPCGPENWYIINCDPDDMDYLWCIYQCEDEITVKSVSRKYLTDMRVGDGTYKLERDLFRYVVNAARFKELLTKKRRWDRWRAINRPPDYGAF